MIEIVKIVERINCKKQTWERSYDDGKTWEPVDWSAYPCFPFTSVGSLDEYILRREPIR